MCRFRVRYAGLLLVGTAVLILSGRGRLYALPEPDVDLAGKRPTELAQSLFEKYKAIPPEDRTRIERMLDNALNNSGNYMKYDALSESRRIRLNKELAEKLSEYKMKEFNTPALREMRLKVLEMTMNSFFNTPVYSYQSSPALDRQLSELADAIVDEALKRYPDIAGSPVPKRLREHILNNFAEEAGNDMVPTMKCPLPEEEYEAYKAELLTLLQNPDPDYQGRKLPLSPRWERMSEEERKQYLEKSADDVVTIRLMPDFIRSLMEIGEKYRFVAIRDMFSEENAMENAWRDPIPDMSNLVKEASEERSVQLQQLRKNVQARMEQRRLEGIAMRGFNRPPAGLDAVDLNDPGSLPGEDSGKSPIDQVKTTPTTATADDEPENSSTALIGIPDRKNRPRYGFYLLAAAATALLVVLTKRLTTSKTQD